MTKNSRYVAGLIKNINGHIYVKWKFNKAYNNKSYLIPSKKLNKKIKLNKD